MFIKGEDKYFTFLFRLIVVYPRRDFLYSRMPIFEKIFAGAIQSEGNRRRRLAEEAERKETLEESVGQEEIE